MRVIEKYENQLTQTRKSLPTDIIKRLKTDSEFIDKTSYSLIELAYLCGYDVLDESKNARYLEFFTKFKLADDLFTYIVDKGVQTFKLTRNFAHDKENIYVRKKKKNWKTGQWYVNEFDKTDLRKAILYHTFSYELCQKRVEKQFKEKGVHTKLSIKQQQNAYLINKTIGISLRPQSAIYVIDIDCNGSDEGKQKADNTLKKIVDIHPKRSIAFIERSFSGAYHVAIRFGDINGISLTDFKKYIEHTNKTILNSDKYAKIDTTSNGLRLLFSSTYYPIKYDYNYPHDFSEMYESVFDAINNVKKNYYDTESIYFEYPINKEEPVIVKEVAKVPTKEVATVTRTSSIYANRLNTSYIYKERISEGHRWEVQKKLIPRMKILGHTKEQVWEHLLSIDDGCRAGRENPDKWQKEVYEFYDKGYEFFTSNNNSSYTMTDEYRPQHNHLPDDLKNLISDNSFLNDIIMCCGKKQTPRNREIFKTLLYEIYGTFIYDTKNPKQIKEKQNPNYLIGSQYSQTMCERMKDYFPILKHTDVYGFVRDILNCTLLFKEYNPFFKGRSWIYISDNHEDNKCKQWLLNINNVLKYNTTNVYNYILMSIVNYVRIIINNKDKVSEVFFFIKHYNIFKLFMSLDDDMNTKIDELLLIESLKAG